MIRWKEEYKQWLREHVPGRYRSESYADFIATFPEFADMKYETYISALKRYKIGCGMSCVYMKENPPWNKGKKVSPEMYEKMKKSFFPKGHRPASYRPIGSERVNCDGYVEIKTDDKKRWELKHRVIWQEAYGPIPDDSVIMFRDGNPLNLELSNLMLVSKRVIRTMNRHKYKFDGENTDTILKLVELRNKLSEVKKNGRTKKSKT